MGMVQKLYGRHYDLHPLNISPEDVGHAGVARARVYIVMAYRGLVTEHYDVQEMFRRVCQKMRQFVCTEPSDYFVADEAQ